MVCVLFGFVESFISLGYLVEGGFLGGWFWSWLGNNFDFLCINKTLNRVVVVGGYLGLVGSGFFWTKILENCVI